jgi:single-strand DNA-binding protein
MEIIGSLTQDAKSEIFHGESKVLSFSSAVNNSYSPKDQKGVKITTCFNCSYWKHLDLLGYPRKGE